MKKKLKARQIFEQAYRAIDEAAHANGETGVADPALPKKLARRLNKYLTKAFAVAKRDLSKPDDREFMLYIMALAIFAPRGPGAPIKWTKKRLRRLLKDFANLKTMPPKRSEDALCRQLVAENDNYKEMSPATLRRQLQRAKSLAK